MTRKRTLRWVIGVTFMAAGCGGGPVSVRGRVLLDDVPVAGATVMLMPVEGGHPATALSDADGVFRLSTYQRQDGALPGRYKIIVTKNDALPPPPEGQYGDAERVTKHYKAVKASRDPKRSLLPAIYGDAQKTPLRCTVPPDGEVVLRLQSKAK
jgi:hypothetical protein